MRKDPSVKLSITMGMVYHNSQKGANQILVSWPRSEKSKVKCEKYKEVKTASPFFFTLRSSLFSFHRMKNPLPILLNLSLSVALPTMRLLTSY